VPRPREHAEALTYPFEPPADDLTAVFFVTKTLLNGHVATLWREGLVVSGGTSLGGEAGCDGEMAGITDLALKVSILTQR